MGFAGDNNLYFDQNKLWLLFIVGVVFVLGAILVIVCVIRNKIKARNLRISGTTATPTLG